MSTIFTKIITGEIPSYKIWEDELTFAFLDIFPFKKGHALVVPKIEVDYFVDLPDNYYKAIFDTARLLAPAIQKAVGCSRVGLMIQGDEVPHTHIHLIPMYPGQSFTGKKAKLTPYEMEEIQESILSHLVD